MANPLHANPAASNALNICNAESEAGHVSKSAVLEIIARQRAAYEFLNVAGGLSPVSPCRFTRERFEIVAGKLLALDSVAGLIRQLPPMDGKNLMAGKPSFQAAVAAFPVIRRALVSLKWMIGQFEGESGAGANYWDEKPEFRAAVDCANILSICISGQSSGSAEEQPERREEARPLMGTPPVTAAAPNPPVRDLRPVSGPLSPWVVRLVENLPSADLRAASEAILDELEAREGDPQWQTVD